jgi:single-stranded DNA-binding protein
MNRVFLSGRLTADPELIVNDQGHPVTTLLLSVEETVGSTTVRNRYPLVVRGPIAVDLARHFTAHTAVIVEGRLVVREPGTGPQALPWRTEVEVAALERIGAKARSPRSSHANAIKDRVHAREG